MRSLTKQVGVPSVQANHSAWEIAESITRWTGADSGRMALRIVVAPTRTPVSSHSLSAEANDTRGMPPIAAQKSRVTKGLSSDVT